MTTLKRRTVILLVSIMAVALGSTAMAQVYTDPVGFAKVDAIAHGLTMVSVPLKAQDMRLNGDEGCLGDMIKENMVGSDSSAAADSIFIWDAVNKKYSQLFLGGGIGDPAYDGKWIDAVTFDVSTTMTLAVGDAFWIDRRGSTGATTAQITFLGWVPTETSKTVTLQPGLTMFAWPYPTELLLENSTLNTVALGSDSSAAADSVFEWAPATAKYSQSFLVAGTGDPGLDGHWLDAVTFDFSTTSFTPGAGFWFLRQPAQPAISWVCQRPYTLD